MNNSINIEQNKEYNLLLLFSQKMLYENAKNTKYLIILLGLLNFILGITSNTFSDHRDKILIIAFIILIVSKALNKNACKFNTLAATTQELVDRKLFGFEIESRHLDGNSKDELKSKAKDLRDKMPKKYSDNINNSGYDRPRGVKNWYSDIAPNLSIEKAIIKCQGQNIYWDKALIKFYQKLLLILNLIIVIIFLLLYWNKEVKDVVLGVISSYLIFEILIKELFKTNEYINNCNLIDAIIARSSSSNETSLELLKDLQSKIYSRRKSGFNIPTFIHELNTNKLHKKYSRDN
ncbi:S-4TM family putative pore-forming effector [Metaclostridioides mangenotii]|uniref:SMODS and SLOG-associating 2TM effector domain-containing protein n=1 Tax=Metaclostridioides mangenotii TaxID=1540 RepID=A0ABS4EEL8_9FIRM|nr:S-4TM family putative pore-forming effector [Clostridioides mangenotii]MBP1856377.1 hypothetical protein [Clostridioides mangenotii]